MNSVDEVEILTSVSKSLNKWVMYVEYTTPDYDVNNLLRDVPCVKAHSHVRLVTSGMGYVTFDTKAELESAFADLKPKSIRALGCDPTIGVYLDTESNK